MGGPITSPTSASAGDGSRATPRGILASTRRLATADARRGGRPRTHSAHRRPRGKGLADHSLGNGCILDVTEQVLEPRQPLAETSGALRRLALERSGGKLGGVPRALHRDPRAMEVVDRAVGIELVGATLEPVPGAEHERAEAVGNSRVGRACRWCHRRGDEVVQERHVGIPVEHRHQALAGGSALSLECLEQRCQRGGRAIELTPHPEKHDVGVTSIGRGIGDRAQARLHLLAPPRIDRIAERAQVAPQPAHRDPQLVDALRLAEACLRIVADDPRQRVGDAGRDDVGKPRIGGDRLRGDLRRSGCARAERAHDLRDRLGLGGAGGPELVAERLEVDSIDEGLDLELAEAGHDPAPLDDRHLVIGHLRDRCLVDDEVDAAPAGAERRDGGERLAARVCGEQRAKLCRRARGGRPRSSAPHARAPSRGLRIGSFSVQRGVSASPVR